MAPPVRACAAVLALALAAACASAERPTASRAPALAARQAALPARGKGALRPAPPTPSAATHWGVLGVGLILLNAISRFGPVALEPLRRRDLTLAQGCAYAATVASLAYVKGHRALSKKFTPLVVARAFTLGPEGGCCTALRAVLAPLYSIGLFHATAKRMAVGWGIMAAVACLVVGVKRLPYPWRSIVDAGVAVGLSLGVAALCVHYGRALAGHMPDADPQLPTHRTRC